VFSAIPRKNVFGNEMNEIAGNGRKRGLDRRAAAAGGRENTLFAKTFPAKIAGVWYINQDVLLDGREQFPA